MKKDIILFFIILIFVVGCASVAACLYKRYFMPNETVVAISGDAGDEVIVFKDGEVFYAGLLSVETTINIEDEKGNFNIVHIKDGKAVMKKASCPDQICVHTRPAEKDGQAIICLPNKVSVEVRNTGIKDIDGVSQ
jgi:hypothetical protein